MVSELVQVAPAPIIDPNYCFPEVFGVWNSSLSISFDTVILFRVTMRQSVASLSRVESTYALYTPNVC